MEKEVPSANNKVQLATKALSNAVMEESQNHLAHAVVQCEDELEQAEENKRELETKLETSRKRLRGIRKLIAKLNISLSETSQKLPLHFIKSPQKLKRKRNL